MLRLKTSVSVAVLAAAAGFAGQALAADQPASVEEVIVTGTREVGIKAADSPAPIQVVGAQVLQKSGASDLATSLAANVPSLNIQTTGGDAAAVQIQAALRGLGPNETPWSWSTANAVTPHPTSQSIPAAPTPGRRPPTCRSSRWG